MPSLYICDCGRSYSSPAATMACQAANHYDADSPEGAMPRHALILRTVPPVFDIIDFTHLDDQGQLSALQTAIEGYLEVIPIQIIIPSIGEQLVMFVNENGRLDKLPINVIASYLARQDIVGNAVILPSSWVN